MARSTKFVFLGFWLAVLAPPPANAQRCSPDDIRSFLDRGMSPEQVRDVCGGAAQGQFGPEYLNGTWRFVCQGGQYGAIDEMWQMSLANGRIGIVVLGMRRQALQVKDSEWNNDTLKLSYVAPIGAGTSTLTVQAVDQQKMTGMWVTEIGLPGTSFDDLVGGGFGIPGVSGGASGFSDSCNVTMIRTGN